MKILIRAIALLFVSALVFAAPNKIFTWEPPIERAADPDTGISHPLPNVEIKEYRIYCDGDTQMPVHIQPNVPLDTDQWTAPHNKFSLGAHRCFATAVDTEGLESAASNVVNFTVSQEAPKAPIFAVN